MAQNSNTQQADHTFGMSNKEMFDSAPKKEQQQVEDLIKKHGNKSNAIRALRAEGKSVAEIARTMKLRYQHVRNVLITPVKKATPLTDSKKEQAAEAERIDERTGSGEDETRGAGARK